MNAVSWKVLKEVRFGLLIMEPNVRGCGVRRRRRRRCSGMKRVSGWSRLTLRCHDATNVRESERKKEKETIRKVPSSWYIKIYKNEGMYAWECMNMWHAKINSSWALPNPNLPAHTHLKCMEHCYNAHVMQCMKYKDHLNKNPSQNFNKNSKVLKNFNQFQKPQKLGQRSWICMIKMKKVSYQKRNKDLETKEEVRNVRGLSLRCLGVREKKIHRERSKEMSEKSQWLLFIEIS